MNIKDLKEIIVQKIETAKFNDDSRDKPYCSITVKLDNKDNLEIGIHATSGGFKDVFKFNFYSNSAKGILQKLDDEIKYHSTKFEDSEIIIDPEE